MPFVKKYGQAWICWSIFCDIYKKSVWGGETCHLSTRVTKWQIYWKFCTWFRFCNDFLWSTDGIENYVVHDFFTDSDPEVIHQAKLEVTFSFSLVLK